MKTRIIIIGAAIGTLVAALSGCAGTGPQWKATGAIVGKRVAAIAFQSVVSAAISPRDADRKQDFLWSAASALEANATSLVNASDVENLLRVWTPAKSHWVALASKLADQYVAAHPQSTKERELLVQSIASGLREAAAK